jgi:multiple sugar transport system ATP-binding protein
VATFIGSPAMNLVEAKLTREDGPAVTFGSYKLPVPPELVSERGLDRYFGQTVIVGIRPSDFEDVAFVSDGSRATMKTDVAIAEELGSEVNLIFSVDAPPVHHEVMTAKFDKASTEAEETAELTAETGQSLWTARVNPKTQARAGRTIELVVDTHAYHFFDKQTGLAIGHEPGSTPRMRPETATA